MGKGDSRPSQPSVATRASTEEAAAADAAAAEAAAVAPPGSGSGPARIPKSSTPPLTTSRTTTLDDPLTTSLLAEIARRPATVEMTPAQLAAARAMAPGGPEPEHARSADPDDHPDDPA